MFVGANGVGKSNLFKSLSLLRDAATGRITHTIAEEGGLESVLWSGPRKKSEQARLILKAAFDDISYSIEIGFPQSFNGKAVEAAFLHEAMLKNERLVLRKAGRDHVLMERQGSLVMLRDRAGSRKSYQDAVLPSETVLANFSDADECHELEQVRRTLLRWRFYHDFRSDAASPVRQPCYAITTPSLSADGHDLAAVFATLSVIREDTEEIQNAVSDAFPGAVLRAWEEHGHCTFDLRFPDMPRAFKAHELSDGTLKYLCLLAVFLGYRLPPFIALNEPETSLHPSLLAPLARLIARASDRTCIWIVTHSESLMSLLKQETKLPLRRVIRDARGTSIEGLKLSGEYDEAED